MATYTVKRNDNLFKIAQNLGLPLASLLAANPNTRNVRAGVVLTLPKPDGIQLTRLRPGGINPPPRVAPPTGRGGQKKRPPEKPPPPPPPPPRYYKPPPPPPPPRPTYGGRYNRRTFTPPPPPPRPMMGGRYNRRTVAPPVIQPPVQLAARAGVAPTARPYAAPRYTGGAAQPTGQANVYGLPMQIARNIVPYLTPLRPVGPRFDTEGTEPEYTEEERRRAAFLGLPLSAANWRPPWSPQVAPVSPAGPRFDTEGMAPAQPALPGAEAGVQPLPTIGNRPEVGYSKNGVWYGPVPENWISGYGIGPNGELIPDSSIVDYLIERGQLPLVFTAREILRLGLTAEELAAAGYEQDQWGAWVRVEFGEAEPAAGEGGGEGGGGGYGGYYGGGGYGGGGGGYGGGGKITYPEYNLDPRQRQYTGGYTPTTYQYSPVSQTGRNVNPARMGLISWRI